MEPSAIWSISMEGALLRHGPSVISSLRVEGWFCLHRTVRDSGLKRGGFGPGEWNHPRYGALAWKVQLWSSNCPRYRHQPWKVQPLNPELSVICVFIADGWLCLHRTVRDMEHYRGRFASGIWTVRDIESQRGRFNPWISNCS